MPVKSAVDSLWTKLSRGSLTATAIDASGAVVRVPSHEWPYLALEADDKLLDRLVFTNGRHARAYDKVTVRRSDVVVLWQGGPEPPHIPMKPHLQKKTSWSFLEAATWVGCKGRDLPSKQVADQDLEEKGAYALFRALFPERGLIATGLNSKRLREAIPAEYWEMATMNPERYREWHYLSFVDEVLDGYGGQLTPVGEDRPRWFGIRLDRDALFAAFPDIVADGADAHDPVASRVGRRKRTATHHALVALHPTGVPQGLSQKELLAAVNKWLRARGSSEVSTRTLARVTANYRSAK